MSSSWNFERVPLFARFFFSPSTVDVSHMSTLPTVFWKQSHVCPWTRIYEQPRSFQAYIARAGAWPFLSPFLPFAATVDRFFFFLPLVIPQSETRSVEHWLLPGSNDTLDFSSLYVNIYVRIIYLFSLYVLRNLFSSLDHVYISILFLHLHLITFTKESLVGISYRKFSFSMQN